MAPSLLSCSLSLSLCPWSRLSPFLSFVLIRRSLHLPRSRPVALAHSHSLCLTRSLASPLFARRFLCFLSPTCSLSLSSFPPLSLSLSLSHSPVIQAYIRSTRSPCFFFVHRHARFECRSSLVLHLICTKGAEFPCRVILRHVFGARARFRLSSVRSSVAHFRGSRKRNRIYIKLDKRHVIDNENA
jgi:hypothetical protein